MTISASLRRQVIERADNRCEYCGLAQTGQEAAFHIDHIVPVAGGGVGPFFTIYCGISILKIHHMVV
jgi:hypothetical protein